jgi:hypothetical protein
MEISKKYFVYFLALIMMLSFQVTTVKADDDDSKNTIGGDAFYKHWKKYKHWPKWRLAKRVAKLEAQVEALTAAVAEIASNVAEIESNNALDLDPYVRVDEGEINGLSGPQVIF